MASAAFSIGAAASLEMETVAASSVTTISLDSTDGVRTSSVRVTSTDDTTVPADWVIADSTATSTTITAPAGLGTGAIIEWTVNSGITTDRVTGQPSVGDLVKKAKIAVTTATGRVVACAGEEYETDPTFGWTGLFNELVRDNSSSGALNWKSAVRCATTANITLSGAQTIDGVSAIAGDRVLVKNQSTASANGIYTVGGFAWVRATDADVSAEVTANLGVMVSEGTTLADTCWILTTNNPITLGSTSLVFAQFGSGTDLSPNGTLNIATSLTDILNLGNATCAVNVASGALGITVDGAIISVATGTSTLDFEECEIGATANIIIEAGTTCAVSAGTVLALSAGHSVTSGGKLLDWAPLVANMTAVANAAGRSGTRTEATLTYDSTIDPGTVTGLSARICYDDGVATALGSAPMPMLLLVHGYAGTEADWAIATMRQFADMGFFVVAVAKRGDTSSPHSAGGADDCRDTHDYVDAIVDAVATYPTIVDGVTVDVFGLSGGSFAAGQMLTKFVGRFRNILAGELGFDLGVNPAVDASYWGQSGSAEIEARVGTRATSIQPYRARNGMTSLCDALRQSTTKLWALWDEDDAIGITMRSIPRALEQGRVPRSQWYCAESLTADALRWEHGYPDAIVDWQTAMRVLGNRLTDPAPTAAEQGEYIVTGYLVHAAGFEVWTADTGTANCRDEATGGREHVVRVIYDAASGQFYAEPMSGACAATIIWGGLSVTREVTMSLTLFDVANDGVPYPPVTWAGFWQTLDVDANVYTSFEPIDVTAQDSTVTNWADGIGALDLSTVEGSPVHDSTPGEVLFDGIDTVIRRAITLSGAFGLCIRLRCTGAADVSPINLHDEAETALGRQGLYIPADRSGISHLARADGGSDNTLTDSLDNTFSASLLSNVITTSGTHGLAVDQTVTVSNSGGALPGGLAAVTTYYVLAGSFTATTFKLSLSSGGAEVDITDAGTGTHTVHGFVSARYRVVFLNFDGSSIRTLQVDDRAPVSLAVPGAATLTRLTLGVLQHAAARFYFHDGAISNVGLINGRELTSGNITAALAWLAANA